MKSTNEVRDFIELRALDFTYDEIVKELRISKPTLIKWGELYRDEIKQIKEKLTLKLVEEITEKNKELILTIAEQLKRADQSEDASMEIRDKFKMKSIKRMEDIFRLKVKTIDILFGKGGDVLSVRIISE